MTVSETANGGHHWWQGPATPLVVAIRGAIVATCVLGGLLLATGNLHLTLFATFGTVCPLMMGGLEGNAADRLRTAVFTTVVGVVLLVIGLQAVAVLWVAVLVAFLVTFAIESGAVLSYGVARARMPLLLPLVVALTAPSAPWQPAVLGWVIGGCVAALASLVPWPSPQPGGPRGIVMRKAEALAATIRGEELDASAVSDRDRPVSRPFGGGRKDHELRRAGISLQRAAWFATRLPSSPTASEQQWIETAAEAFDLVAALVSGGLTAATRAVTERLAEARAGHEAGLHGWVARRLRQGDDPEKVYEDLVDVHPAYALQIFAVESALHAARYHSPDTPQPDLEADAGNDAAGNERLGRRVWLFLSTAQPGSAWLHRSIRLGIGVALGVLISQLTHLPHSFWIVLATVSVLRPSGLGTERSYLKTIAGTLIGFVLSWGLIAVQHLLGGTALLWIAFPVALFLWSYAPVVFSKHAFVAMQAGFTIVLVLMFTVLEPAAFPVGVVRLADVLIGGGLAVVVASILWPRHLLRRVGSEAGSWLRSACVYLDDAVYGGAADTVLRDRDIAENAQWRTYAALSEYAQDHGPSEPEASDLRPVLDQAVQLGVITEVLGHVRKILPGAEMQGWLTSLGVSCARLVASTLLLAEEVERGRRLCGRRAFAGHGQTREAAVRTLARWGGRGDDEDARVAVATVRSCVWLRQGQTLVDELLTSGSAFTRR